MVPKENTELRRHINELTIRWTGLVRATKIDQFKEVGKRARALDDDIKKLSQYISHK